MCVTNINNCTHTAEVEEDAGQDWGEVVMTIAHLLNHLPTKSFQGNTTYEAWHGHTPSVSYLKVFGCIAYAKDLGQL